MGLFDKFKKKENVVNSEQPEVKQEAVVNQNDVSSNQAIAAEVSIDNNPFFEEVAPVVEEAQPQVPSFDNIFNAGPADLISSENQVSEVSDVPNIADTAAVVDNPNVSPQNDVFRVDPVAVFEGGDTTYDEITNLVSGVVSGEQGADERTEVVSEPQNNEIQLPIETPVEVKSSSVSEIELPQAAAVSSPVVEQEIARVEPPVVVEETDPETTPTVEGTLETSAPVVSEIVPADSELVPVQEEVVVPAVDTRVSADTSTGNEEVSLEVEETSSQENSTDSFSEGTEAVVGANDLQGEAVLEENTARADVNEVENTNDNIVLENGQEEASQEVNEVAEQDESISITSAPILEQIVPTEIQEDTTAPMIELSSNQTAQEIAVDSSIAVLENANSVVPQIEETVPSEEESFEEDSEVVSPEYDEEIQDINVSEAFIPPEIVQSTQNIEDRNEEINGAEEQVVPPIDTPVVELTSEQEGANLQALEEGTSLETVEEVVPLQGSEDIPRTEEQPIVGIDVNALEEDRETNGIEENQEIVEDIANGEESTLTDGVNATEAVEEAPVLTDETVEEISVLQEQAAVNEVEASQEAVVDKEPVAEEDAMSILERTNEMILNSILEAEDEEDSPEEGNIPIVEDNENMDEEQGTHSAMPIPETTPVLDTSFEETEPVQEDELVSVTPLKDTRIDSTDESSKEENIPIFQEEMELPIIASEEAKNESETASENEEPKVETESPVNNEKVEENVTEEEPKEEVRPILEDEETVIFPVLTEEDITNYKKADEIVVKPLFEEEQDELNVGILSDEETYAEVENDEARARPEETLPVLDLDETQVEESTAEVGTLEENESILNGEVTTPERSFSPTPGAEEKIEEVPTEESEVPAFDFKPFMNLNNMHMESEEGPVAVEASEMTGTYISEPTQTKFCNNCGIMLTGDSSICPSCGEPID